MAIQRIILDVLMTDGTQHEGVVVTIADRMRLASAARRYKWGTLESDPDQSLTFLAFAALNRSGRFAGSWDEFVASAEAIAEAGVEEVDPTTPAM